MRSGERFPTTHDLVAALARAVVGLAALWPTVGYAAWHAVRRPELQAAAGPEVGALGTTVRVASAALVLLVGLALLRDAWRGRLGRRAIDRRTRSWLVLAALVVGAAPGAVLFVLLGTAWPLGLVPAGSLGLGSVAALWLGLPARSFVWPAVVLVAGGVLAALPASLATAPAEALLPGAGPWTFVVAYSAILAAVSAHARRVGAAGARPS